MHMIAEHHQVIDEILEKYEGVIGTDFDRYRNHVYRVFHLCCAQDDTGENAIKYAIAAAFHDIGIWTHHTFDYLKPSIELVREYLKGIGKPEWQEEVSHMIDMHHKMTRYSGAHQKTVEIFRRADWIDVSLGLIRFKVEVKIIQELRKAFPLLGFHGFLVRQTLKNFLRHPFNPLPMFKK